MSAVLMLAGCSLLPGGHACNDRRVPAAAVPEVGGFVIASADDVEPAGCGAGWKRHAVIESDAVDDDAALAQYAGSLVEDSWKPVDCVTRHERCFDSDEGYFLAATTPAGAQQQETPDGYPDPIGDQPQVLVSVSLR